MKTATYNPLTHKIVPIEPTDEMAQSYYKGQRHHGFWNCAPVYASVIAAAPEYQESALPDDWKKNVMALWTCARKNDSTIPDRDLDMMRDVLLSLAPEGDKP